MEDIMPRLYIGGDADYEKLSASPDRPGWSYLRCNKYGTGGHQQTLKYTTPAAPQGKDYLSVRRGNLLALNMLDLDDPNFVSPEMIRTGLDFIRERLDAGDKVLVSCNQGQSRAPTMGLMFMRSVGEMPLSFVQSERVYRTFYPHYNPKQGIRQYARSHWAELANSEDSEHDA
jgi:hypothetical protein